jgi:hypothetical protein
MALTLKGEPQLVAKKSGLSKMADVVTTAAQTTAQVANEYVVAPVGKALGLIETKPPQTSKSARKADRKALIARSTTKPTIRPKATR